MIIVIYECHIGFYITSNSNMRFLWRAQWKSNFFQFDFAIILSVVTQAVYISYVKSLKTVYLQITTFFQRNCNKLTFQSCGILLNDEIECSLLCKSYLLIIREIHLFGNG